MELATSFKRRITKKYSPNNEKQDLNWLGSVDATLGLLRNRPRNSSTYRIPSRLRAVKDEAYTPRMVSIGPFHRTKPELLIMEELKWSYMLAYVDRVAKSDLENNQSSMLDGESSENTPQRMALQKCSKIVSELEEEARAWYAEDINLDKYQLMEMLLVDGCFILELLYRHKMVSRERSSGYIIPVEDGPPFKSLAGAIVDKFFQPSILSFFRYSHMLLYSHNKYFGEERYGKKNNFEDGTYIHLLDIFYHVCNFPHQILPSSNHINWGFKRCAAELFKSGIQFIVDDKKTIVDISFSEGKIYIPPVFVDNSSDTIYRNLIAYEQTSNGRYAITSYVTLMSTLIRSPEDAYILEQAHILENVILEDVSGFFESLCIEVVSANFCFADLCHEVENYQIPPWGWHRVNGYFIVTWYRWKKSMKDLKREYFRNTWSIIAFLAAAFVIVLTGLQTFYTIRAYYPPYH